jgi:lysozyme
MRSGGFLIGAAIAAFFVLVNRQGGSGDSRYAGEISEGDAAFEVDTPVTDSWDDDTPLPGDLFMRPDSLSDDGLEKLKTREGFSAVSYPDHKGRSIGYGHLIKSGETFSEPMDRATALNLLASDVSWAVDAVNNHVTGAINQSQFDALVSFVYNVGSGAFANSTLLRKINANDASAVNEFPKWINASGVVNQSLIARRSSEVMQYLA